MNIMPTPSSPLSLCSFVLLSTLVGLFEPLRAQTGPDKPAPAANDKNAEDAMKLQAFVVSSDKDKGYAATNAFGVTRMDTPLMEISQMVTVVNRQFLDDTGATTLYDALRYVSGISERSNVADTGLTIRGYQMSTAYTDGFADTQTQSQMGAEPFLYERIEVMKGPNALVYGSHAGGGLVNKVRKVPQWKAGGLLALTVGNYNQYKGELDYNLPVGDKLAFRVLGVYRDEDLIYGEHVNGAWAHRWNFAPMVTWRPSPNTQLRVSGEFLNESHFKHYGDAFMLQPFTSGGASVYTDISGTSFGKLPRNFSVSDTSARAENTKYAVLVALESEVMDNWSIRVATYTNWWAHDSLDVANQGVQANNQFLNRNWPLNTNDNYDMTGSVDSILKFNFLKAEHKLLFISQFHHEGNGAETFQGGTQVSGSLMLIPIPFDIYNPVYGNLGPFHGVHTVKTFTENNSWGTSVQDEARFFRNRLIAVAGVRYDWYTTRTDNLFNKTSGATSRGSATTAKYGLIYRPNQSFSAYYNHSETYAPNFGANPDGTTFVPSRGLIDEIGLKSGLLDGRISGSISVFDLVQNNLLVPDPYQPRQILGYRVQTARQTTKGIDADMIFSVTRNLDLIVSAAKIKVKLPSGLQPQGTPERTAAAWARYQFPNGSLKGLAFGGGGRWQSDFFSETGNQIHLPGWHTFDFFAQYAWGSQEVALNISNVTDEWYLDRGVTRNAIFHGPDRSIKVRYVRKF